MAEALVRLIIRADGVPELQKTAEVFKKVSQAIKGTEKDLVDLDKQFRRGVHAPTFAPGWQGQAGAGGGGIGAGVGVAGGALLGAIRAHPLLTTAGVLLAARGAIRAYGEEEMTLARTEALLRAQGIEDMKEAARVATDMASKTLPSYRDQMEAIGSLMLITGDYTKALKDLSMVNDISAITGYDLNMAALAYGRALEGDTILLGKYVQGLKKLNEEQKKDKELVRETIRQAIPGVAEAQAQTPTGQLTQARKEIGEAMQVGGEILTNLLAPVARGFTGLVGGIRGLIITPEQEALLADVEKLLNPVKEVERTYIDIGLATGGIVTKLQSETTITGGILALRKQIAAEMQKEDFSITAVAKSMRGILDLEEKRKSLQQEIAGIAVGPQHGRIGRVGALAGAVAGLGGEPETRVMTPEGPRWIPASGKFALTERFGGMRLAPGLTLGQALHEREGITGFDVFKQEQLGRLSQREDLPTSLRAQFTGELFQNQLGMLGRATTPGMQAQMFGGAVQAMDWSQKLEVDKAGEDIADRKEMIGNLGETVNLLGLIHGTLLEIKAQRLPSEVSQN